MVLGSIFCFSIKQYLTHHASTHAQSACQNHWLINNISWHFLLITRVTSDTFYFSIYSFIFLFCFSFAWWVKNCLKMWGCGKSRLHMKEKLREFSTISKPWYEQLNSWEGRLQFTKVLEKLLWTWSNKINLHNGTDEKCRRVWPRSSWPKVPTTVRYNNHSLFWMSMAAAGMGTTRQH